MKSWLEEGPEVLRTIFVGQGFRIDTYLPEILAEEAITPASMGGSFVLAGASTLADSDPTHLAAGKTVAGNCLRLGA